VVKAFVEMHGGTINVSSEVGKGTSFVIWLPPPALASDSAPAAAQRR
jgi:signal transduction histidine kinase